MLILSFYVKSLADALGQGFLGQGFFRAEILVAHWSYLGGDSETQTQGEPQAN